MSTRGAEDLYEIIRERYEQKPIIVTSNRAPEEWVDVFGNYLMASAALDRLTHHAHFIEMKGQSYRQRQRRVTTGSSIFKKEEDRQPESLEESISHERHNQQMEENTKGGDM